MKEKTDSQTDSQKALYALTVAMIVGIVSVIIYAIQAGGKENFLGIASIGVLIAGGAAFAGGALGFLFGIPRTLQGDDANRKGEVPTNSAAKDRQIEYQANTNLEQISDWLTKILVGVGLTQVSQIGNSLKNLTKFFAKGLGNQDQAQVFALAILLYSIVLGFFFGYLWTRLYLAGALRAADQASIGSLTAEVKKVTEKAELNERKLDLFKLQSQHDADALNLVYLQLNPSNDPPKVTQEELDTAVSKASKSIKIQIFNKAWEVRSTNWRDKKTKAIMELSIPVFKALISSDTENLYHANHAQLGYALKDKLNPDWVEAERELTRAIQIRGGRNTATHFMNLIELSVE